MLPIRDDNPQLRTAFVTFTIIGLNVAAWILVQRLGSEPALSRSICQLGLIPGDVLGRIDVPAAMANRLPCPVDGEGSWLTVLSSMFLHGGWMHLIGNMWFLWIFGNNVEDSMGHLRFVVFYLLCGLVAAMAHVLSEPGSTLPVVGASGAISAIMGAYLVLYPAARVRTLLVLVIFITFVDLPAWVYLGYWFLIQLASSSVQAVGATGGVAFMAHIGGFVAGLLLIFVFRNPKLVGAKRAHVKLTRNQIEHGGWW